MFVKVTEVQPNGATRDLFLNSDCVAILAPDGSFYKIIFIDPLANANTLNPPSITRESGDYFLTCVEAQSAQVAEPADPPSLKTRIAQALRYDFPHGARVSYLEPLYPKSAQSDIEAALIELQIEKVALEIAGFWYHASNSPLKSKPSPDPSTEAADLNSNPAESTETT